MYNKKDLEIGPFPLDACTYLRDEKGLHAYHILPRTSHHVLSQSLRVKYERKSHAIRINQNNQINSNQVQTKVQAKCRWSICQHLLQTRCPWNLEPKLSDKSGPEEQSPTCTRQSSRQAGRYWRPEKNMKHSVNSVNTEHYLKRIEKAQPKDLLSLPILMGCLCNATSKVFTYPKS